MAGPFSEKQLEDFDDPAGKSQPVNAKIFRGREPSKKELGEGEHGYSIIAGVKKLHTKIDGVIVGVVLT